MPGPARKPGSLARELFAELAINGQQEIAALAEKLHANRRQISDAAALLKRQGLVKSPNPGIYLLTRLGRRTPIGELNLKSGPKGPNEKVAVHKDTFRERAWRSMRIRRRFTIGDLLSDAAREDEADQTNNAARYVGILRRAGFLRELPKRRPGTSPTSAGYKVFLLVNNTGPRAPVWREKPRVVHDFNTGEDYPCLTD